MKFKTYILMLVLCVAGRGLMAAGGGPRQVPEHDDPRERAEAMERWYGGKPSKEFLRLKARRAEKELKKWGTRIPGTKASKAPGSLAAVASLPVTPTWQNLGPFDGGRLGSPDSSIPDIDSGRVTVILPHPTNSKRLYVGFGGGGLWRCDNADVASTTDWVWTCLTDGIPTGTEHGDIAVGGLAFKPEDPNTLYLALGDPERTGYGDTYAGGGLYISHDGGDTWEQDASIDVSLSTSNMLALPNNILLLAGQQMLMRSVDGISFNWVTQGGAPIYVSSLKRLSNGTLVLFTGTTLCYSTDQGATWNPATVDASVMDLGNLGRVTLAGSPSNASAVWGLAAAGTEGPTKGVLKSTDGGRSWSFVADASNILFKNWNPGYDGSQAWYNEMITVDPKDTNTIFAATTAALYRSTNGGNTWTALTDWTGSGKVYAHPDFHTAAWSQAPDAPKTLYLGNDGGLCIVRDPNRVAVPTGANAVPSDPSFVDNSRNKGLATHLIYSLGSTNAAFPDDARYRISIGLQDNGTRIRRGTLSSSGTFGYLTGADASSTIIHPRNGNLVLATERSTFIIKSTDGGTTTDPVAVFTPNPPDYFDYVIPLIADLSDPSGNTVYTCGTSSIYKSVDFGSTWTPLPLNGIDPAGHAGLKTIGAAKSNSSALAALFYDGAGFTTYNGGTTWTPMSMPSGVPVIGSYIWFDTTNAQVLYLASVAYDANSSHLWKSADGGHTWKALDQNPDGTDNGFPFGMLVHIVQNDVSNSQILYAGTDFGVYQSVDGGLTWARFGMGFPLVSAQDMWIAPDGSFMRAATFGRGVWECQMKSTQMTLAPTAATMQIGSTRPFTATFTGLIGTGVNWTATGGTFGTSSAGTVNYTAPATVGTYTVTATSQSDPTKSATATITVTPKIVVSPATAAVEINATQSLTATVTGTTNTAVTWTTTGGTLSATTGSTVTYTAPATAGTYTVTATSQADTTKKATATLTVTPKIVVSPASATLEINSTQALTATVTGTGNTAVTWTTSGGTLSATTGGTVTYTAPATAGTYTVTATSQADTTKKATATFQVTPIVMVSPTSATLEINSTQSLTATVMILTNTAVTWTTTGGTLSATTGGTVTYTAPATAGTYTVTATSQADTTKKATATLTVTPKVVVSPAVAAIEINSTQALTATVTGTTNTAVNWSATGGTLSATTGGTVTFTAPGTAGTYTVTATSQADTTKTATATLTVTPRIVVSPTAATLEINSTQILTATVTGTANTGVSWTATGGTFNATTGGTVTYTAPATMGTYTVTVSSAADTTKKATTTITVTPKIVVSPTAATLEINGAQAFTTTVTGTTNAGVSWTATGGTFSATTGGTVTYTAPATAGTYTVTATSQADTTKKAMATLTVTPKVVVSPAVAAIEINSTQALTATVTGTTNTGVNWTTSGGTLSTATGGTVTFTAPGTAGTYTVTATSQADTTKTATATLTVTPKITVSPTSATFEINSTQVLTATVTGTTNTAVNWSATGGTLSATTGGAVTYTAPAAAGTFIVTATSQADPTKTATAIFTVTPKIVMSPASTTLEINTTQALTATVTGASDTAVNWTVTGGTLGATTGATVIYTAPTTAGTYTATATSVADRTKTATATLTVTPRIIVSPGSATLEINTTQVLTATVTGTTNTAVNWTATGGTLSATTGGTVTYTAPGTAGTYTVTATSAANATKKATATFTVTPRIVVSPTTSKLEVNATQTLTANVTGTANTGVTWATTGGTLSATTGSSVTFTAPATMGTYTVTATSQADTTKKATATFTVTPRIVVSPATVTMDIDAMQTFTATVTGTTNTAVTWTATGGTLSATTGGSVTFTAPVLAGTYTITATSQADTSKQAAAVVTATPFHMTETEYNDVTSSANPVPLGNGSISGEVTAMSDYDYFAITVPATSSLTLSTGSEIRMTLYNAAGSVLWTSNGGSQVYVNNGGTPIKVYLRMSGYWDVEQDPYSGEITRDPIMGPYTVTVQEEGNL